jgi:hypothetical protein
MKNFIILSCPVILMMTQFLSVDGWLPLPQPPQPPRPPRPRRPAKRAAATAATVAIAISTSVALSAPPPAFALSETDLGQIEKLLEAKIEASNKQLEAKMDGNNKLIEAKMDANNKLIEASIKELKTELGIYPVITAGIAIAYASNSDNRLADALDRFDSQKEGLKKDLERDTSTKAIAGGIGGGVVTVGFVILVFSLVQTASYQLASQPAS